MNTAADLQISEDTIIEELIRRYPKCLQVFDRHNMPCRTCMGAATGTVKEGAMLHDVDLATLLAELRACVESA